jgi:hypothetical protein
LMERTNDSETDNIWRQTFVTSMIFSMRMACCVGAHTRIWRFVSVSFTFVQHSFTMLVSATCITSVSQALLYARFTDQVHRWRLITWNAQLTFAAEQNTSGHKRQCCCSSSTVNEAVLCVAIPNMSSSRVLFVHFKQSTKQTKQVVATKVPNYLKIPKLYSKT